jgi:hypothetical protein
MKINTMKAMLYLGAQMNLNPHFPHLWFDFGEISV